MVKEICLVFELERLELDYSILVLGLIKSF
jgi:hypothetical protein